MIRHSRHTPRLLVALVLALAVTACAPGATTPPPTSGTPAPSATATVQQTTVAPVGRELGRPLSVAELRAAIAEERQSADPWRDVIAAAGVDTTRRPAPVERECAEFILCTVIGSVEGIDDPGIVVAVRHTRDITEVPPPTTPDDLRGPVALRIPRAGPLMFLGHAQPGSAGLAWTVSDAARAIPTMTNGRVLAVDGWLTSVMTSCGPAPMPFNPPLPNPFNCQPPGWIGSDERAADPKIDVQTFAYLEFADAPGQIGNGAPFPPRHGVYLVRWVEYEAANCHNCRRFLVVGRLDASTPSPNDIPNAPEIRSAQQLVADLAANRAARVGQVVFVNGEIDPGEVKGRCAGATLCSIGTLTGADEPVRATPYTVALLIPDPDYPLSGIFSLVVRPDGLEYLGLLAMSFGQERTAIRSIQSLSDPVMLGGGSATVIVHGWLVDSGAPCASATPSDPPDLPFGPCATDWLTATATPIGPGSSGAAGPPSGVRVQSGAYRTFAASPHEEPGVGGVPREGTYLLRQVLLRTTEPDGPRGWQVVARLEP